MNKLPRELFSLQTARSLRTIFSLIFLGMTLLFLALGLGGCAVSPDQAAKAKAVDAELEGQVLEIIRKHPDVILESVQAYQENQQKQQADLRQKVQDQLKAEPRLIIRESPTTGATSQKIVLAEFSDFQCPYCAKAQATIKQFMDKHQDQVTLVYKHFPLVQIHPQALPAAQATWAAFKQAKFWEYHDALFEKQDQLGEDLYASVAKDLGLDIAKFNQDRKSEAAMTAIQKDIELAKSLGISSTPSFLMNGIAFKGALEVSEFESILAQIQQAK